MLEIFQRYAGGESPRSICNDLNRRDVHSPGSTWNRTKWKKVPGTSRRVCELRPESDWIRVSHPELRIIDDLLWQRVQARLRAALDKSHPNTLAKRGRPSRYLLSGLMVCGECGANYIMQDTHAYGCSGHTTGGKHLCSNSVRVKREVAESALLANIKKRLLSDEMTAYVEKQIRAAIRDIGVQDDGPAIESELAGVERKIGKLLDALESVGVSDSLADRLRKLEADKANAEQRLHAARIEREPIDALPDFVPALVERWRGLVAEIESLVGRPGVEPGELDTARGHLQSLLGQVTLKPKGDILWAYPSLKPKKPTLKESRP